MTVGLRVLVWALTMLAWVLVGALALRVCRPPVPVVETRPVDRMDAGAPPVVSLPSAFAGAGSGRAVGVAVPAGDDRRRTTDDRRPMWERRTVRVGANDVAQLGGDVAAAVTVADSSGRSVATVLVGTERATWFPDVALRHQVPVRAVGDSGRAAVAVVDQRRAVVDLRPSAVAGVEVDRGGRISPVGGVLLGRVWMVRPGVVVAWRGRMATGTDSVNVTAPRLAVRAVALVEVRPRLGVGVTWAPGERVGGMVVYRF